jgi:hypothetical protein
MSIREMIELCVSVGFLIVVGRVLFAWMRDREFF